VRALSTLMYFDQSHFDIRCEWGLAGIYNLAPADVVVIVDVLSFSTAVEVAVTRGAMVLPYLWKDESAQAYAREHNATLALGRGRSEYSLSPMSLLNVPPGLRLVVPSPNGSTLAFEARDKGAKVIAGCLRNASAVARSAQRAGKTINVIPAGERWPDGSLRFAIEDFIGAGAIIHAMKGTRSPEAQSAVAAFEQARDDLHSRIASSSSGRELCERGFTGDVNIATEHGVSDTVPVLVDDVFQPCEPKHR
jgi:2-phosphosulfolactate phosphatase